jgi:hypothetical protein
VGGDFNAPFAAGGGFYNNAFADRGGWNQAWRRPNNGQASGFHAANQRFDNPGNRGNANAGYRGGNYGNSGENRGGAAAGAARGGGGGRR